MGGVAYFPEFGSAIIYLFTFLFKLHKPEKANN
jgi:hypothetical protein